MAGGQERTLRRKIKGVQSTKKITKAMELIAASRIMRAVSAIAAARPYYRELSEIVRDLSRAGGVPKSVYTEAVNPVLPEAVIAITSDRGLCGGYNSFVLRHVERYLKARESKGESTILVGVGRKAEGYFRYRQLQAAWQVNGVTDGPTYAKALKIMGDLLDRFEAGEIGQVSMVVNRFYSIGNQRLEQVTIVPIAIDEIREESIGGSSIDFEFEPGPETIVIPLMRQFAMAKVFALLLEAAASEYAFKQRAMKAASDNAEELATKYRRELNRARQDSITTEIMEIVGGAEALRQSDKSIDE
jgi:F-type H+-transporting ATPase subunit gamma